MRKNGSSEDEPSTRKRGRPTGKNRVPLSIEERRARNTQYERERRNDKAKAMAELAEAAGCESTISAPDLLATVINQIQNAAKGKSSDDINNLREINKNLMSEITKLENELMLHCPNLETNSNDEKDLNSELDSEPQPAKSLGSTSSERRSRNKKPTGKRKRKVRCEESDSQDSVGFSSGDDKVVYETKRIKSHLESHKEDRYELISRRETRSCSSSLSSHVTSSSQSNQIKHKVTTFYQTEFDRESNSSNQMSQTELSESSIAATPPLMDINTSTQQGLPSMFDDRNWTPDYHAPTLTHQFQPELDYASTPLSQDPVMENIVPDDLGLLALDNLDFLEEGDVNFINDQCEWFDSLVLNTSGLDHSGNHLIY